MVELLTVDLDGPTRKGVAPCIEVQYPRLFGVGEYFVYRVQEIVVFDLCHMVWFKLS